MSAQVRADAARLQHQYAKNFGVPVETVHVEYEPDAENAYVWADGHPEWSLGPVTWHRGNHRCPACRVGITNAPLAAAGGLDESQATTP